MPTFKSFSLKPFDINRSSFSPEETAYFDFYNINFSLINDTAIQHNFGYFILGSFSIATHYYSSKEFKKTVV
ncbi:MAG: hypothetical protein KAG18_07365, partial [Sinobacterium sp.]|nr:hypothetical protein [Sinobacterium sp.]